MGSSSYSGKGTTSTPSYSGKSSTSRYNGKSSTSSYSGKSSSSRYSGKNTSYSHESKESNSRISKMREALTTLEELEMAKNAIVEAQKTYKEIEKKLKRQLRSLEPETRARFKALLGESDGPGGEDR